MADSTAGIRVSPLRKGQVLSGFVVLDVVALGELGAAGVWARHLASGAEVFHVLNGDCENLFAFAFATAPQDDSGVAHILEHSVLCGSERFPLKDAFLVLAQGSLQTFLNAWTFPDKTVYPASSVNAHDYFNLMLVYGDAVFRPLLSEWTFMQEGHRLAFAEGGGLSVTGVVFNEMKGAYSSLDAYAGLWSVKAVLPDTPYSFDSGGVPRHIPDLSLEGLRGFHRSRYAPANCRVFLAGDIPTERQLAFLDGMFFSSLAGGAAALPVPRQARWGEPRSFQVPCPAGSGGKATAFLSWLCADVSDTGECLALAVLAEILLGHDGSPLARALIESGVGEDLAAVSGLEGEIRESVFVAGLRGISGDAASAGARLEAVVLGELRRLVAEGIPRGEVEAALLAMEFSHREIRRAGGPFSLVWMRRSLRGWLHGGKPWDTLLFAPGMAAVKGRLAADCRYFESLVQKYLLDNPHRALVTLVPQEGFLEEEEGRFARALAEREQALGAGERAAIAEKAAALEAAQSAGDSPQALASIPHLSRGDLSAEVELIPRAVGDLRGVPALCHELHTNGITYADFAFPLDVLPPADYLWLPFFARAVVSVGLPGMDYGEVSSLLARTVGGFNAILHAGAAAPIDAAAAAAGGGLAAAVAGRDWLIYRLKCLDGKAAPSLDLALRLIAEADFSDGRRVRDLAVEMKNEFDSGFAPSGHSYASCRAGRFASRSRSVDELWGGLAQLEFAHRLAEMDVAEIAAKLFQLREAVAAAGVIANLTGSAAALRDGGALAAERFSRFGPPKGGGAGTARLDGVAPGVPPAPGAEVFASPSLQIGFAAMSLSAAPFDTPAQTAEAVLAHQLSTGALWEDIRMKGGAYGAFASSDSLEKCFSLATYRDPNPLRSLETFSAVLKKLACQTGELAAEEARHAEDELVKTVIGCYARETRPRAAAEKGITDFFRFLCNIGDDYRRRKLQRLIGVSAADITAAVRSLAAQTAANPVVIAGMKSAEQAAKTLGVEMRVLPV